jgi:hypothetical protein
VGCDGGIRYLESGDGTSWAATSFVPAIDVLELDPQVAVDGDTVYVAYSMLAPQDGGCGGEGLLNLGVYLKSKDGPGGSWSDPVRVGPKGDRLQAFRVANGVLHLIVSTDDGSAFYESVAGASVSRIPLPDAQTPSLRVGDDGQARMAYTTGSEIRFARVDGRGLSVTRLGGSEHLSAFPPVLVVDAHDASHVVWTQQVDVSGGCAEPDDNRREGTFYATDESGHWVTRQISGAVGRPSLTMDPIGGRLDLIVQEDGSPLTYLTSGDGDTWTKASIPDDRFANPLLRLDPNTGELLLFGIDATRGVYVRIKP